MSVSFFWRRTSADTISSLSPQELLALVPYWQEQQDVWDAGLVMGVTFHCSVLDRVLGAACADQSAAELAVYGGEPRRDLWTSPDGEVKEYTVVTVLTPESVAAVAEALSEAPYEPWSLADPRRVAEVVSELGFSTEWDDEWARSVIDDLHRLRAFYGTAAKAGDAMVKYLSY
ncbi:hypothetical protein SRB5_03650 [Streptomyces sp. RB5]|uniref:DUF1877 family protein n=1 Tax=Streptomyces smaragdinus TaxID=2585196 RepID=A0A7K0CA09_9ACTN|nr:DUF1877 family protein [Streptomyces smaragdinus]MQY10258.1 hypothetical protein [Streptomyces smaragdinus]